MAGRRRLEGLLLAPGAGADASHHTLTAIEAAVAPLPVHRMDFPYRRAGRRAPDRAPILLDAMRAELEDFRIATGLRDTSRIVLGGRSMGGRMASMIAASGTACRGLVLLSYPLHPPGKPEKLRVDHFADIVVPTLFVSGERDPFGAPGEFAEHVGRISGPVTQVWVGGGHDPRADETICATIVDWLGSLGRS